MKPTLSAVLTLLAALAFSSAVQGAGESFLVDMWDVERGLPSSTVTGVVQAPDGYLWLSTLNGLVQFDGINFHSFVGSRTPGLKVGGFNDIAVAGSGEIWAVDEYGELVFRDQSGFHTLKQPRAAGSMKSLQTDSAGFVWTTLLDGTIARCAAGQVHSVTRSEELGGLAGAPAAFSDGTAWLVTGNGKLMEWKESQLLERPPPGANGQIFLGMSADHSGSVWLMSSNAIWQWRGQQWTPVALPTNASGPFSGLRVEQGGNVWIWSKEGSWRLQQGEWVTTGAPPLPVTEGFNPNTQLVDASGRAWFGTRGHGLVVVNPSGQVTVLSVQQGLPSNFIKCLAQDNEGNIWAGTDRGLVRIKPKRLAVISWADPKGEVMATGLAEDRDGRLWIGSYGDGLLRLDAGERQSQAQPAFANPKSCRALVFDGNNRLWVGSVDEGLWSMENGRLSHAVDEAHLPAGHARSLLADARGRLWIGTTKGLFSLADGRLTPHPTSPGLGEVDVRAIVENADGSLWIGTERHGLMRWHDETWEQVPRASPDALLSVWSLYQDHEGSLWIGTEDGGLARWRAGRLELFNRTNGLAADTICSILEDDRKGLWLGTYNGIFHLKKSECDAVASGQMSKLLPEVFTRSEGMPTVQCTGSFQPTACRTRDGRLCFPTIKGVVVIDPKLEAPPSAPPPVLIEEVELAGRALDPGSDLRLGPLPKRIAFRFTAPSFSAPERVRFRYRLEGEDKEWIDAGTDRIAVFDTLPPGRHEFHVTACNAAGIWNEQGASLVFMVVPVWWQTWWFQGSAMAAMVLLAAAIVRQVITRRLQRRLEMVRRQGTLDRERSRIARDIHDELGTSLTRIIMLSQPDDAATAPSMQDLSSIHETARNLTRAMDEVVWAVNPRQDTLEGLVSYISVFAQEFVSAANLGCRLDLPPKVPQQPVSAEVRHSVFLAAKEAINNAVRHARAREIRIALHVEQRSFSIEVADDGIGLDPGRLASNPDPPANGRGGHGLQNMRERMAALGGRCEIKSVPRKGTTVRFVVPLTVHAAV